MLTNDYYTNVYGVFIPLSGELSLKPQTHICLTYVHGVCGKDIAIRGITYLKTRHFTSGIIHINSDYIITTMVFNSVKSFNYMLLRVWPISF